MVAAAVVVVMAMMSVAVNQQLDGWPLTVLAFVPIVPPVPAPCTFIHCLGLSSICQRWGTRTGLSVGVPRHVAPAPAGEARRGGAVRGGADEACLRRFAGGRVSHSRRKVAALQSHAFSIDCTRLETTAITLPALGNRTAAAGTVWVTVAMRQCTLEIEIASRPPTAAGSQEGGGLGGGRCWPSCRLVRSSCRQRAAAAPLETGVSAKRLQRR